MKNPIIQEASIRYYGLDNTINLIGHIHVQDKTYKLTKEEAKNGLKCLQMFAFSQPKKITKNDIHKLLPGIRNNQESIKKYKKKISDPEKQKWFQWEEKKLESAYNRSELLVGSIRNGLEKNLTTTVSVNPFTHILQMEQFNRKIMVYCNDPENFYPLLQSDGIDIDHADITIDSDDNLQQILQIAESNNHHSFSNILQEIRTEHKSKTETTFDQKPEALPVRIVIHTK